MGVRGYSPEGQPLDLDEQEAGAAYASGALRFQRGQRVPVRLADGQVGDVDATELDQILATGGSLAAQESFVGAQQQAQRRTEAGDEDGTAFAEGALRGATFGFSDTLFGSESATERAGARALFGDAAEAAYDPERFQEGVQLRRAENPIAATTGELAGGLATGAAMPVVRAGGVAGRIAGLAVEGAAEGALAEVGLTMGNAALEDEELTGEMLVAAAGDGARLGGLLGGGLGAAAEVARPTLRAMGRAMNREGVNRAIGELAVGHLEPTAAQVDRLRGRNIDIADVGNILLEEGLIDAKVGRAAFVDLADEAMANRLGPRIGDLLEQLDAGASPAAKVDLDALKQRFADIAEQHNGFAPGAFRRVEEELDAVFGETPARNTLIDGLDGQRERLRQQIADLEAAAQGLEDDAARFRQNAAPATQATQPVRSPSATTAVQGGGVADALDDAARRQRQAAVDLGPDVARVDQQISDARNALAAQAARADFAQAHALRRAIDKHLFKGRVGNLQDITPQQQALHDARAAVNAEIDAAMARAAGEAPDGSPLRQVLDSWDDANRRYQALAWAREVARRSSAREMASDLKAGIDLGISPALAVATGNPGWIVAGWLSGTFQKWMRRSGKAFAAQKGDQLARVLGLRGAAEKTQTRIGRAARGLVRDIPGKVTRAVGAIQVATFDAKADAAMRRPTDPLVYDDDGITGIRPSDIADASFNAAAVIGSTRAAQAQALQAKLAAMGAVPSADPLSHGDRPLLSDTERAAWLRYHQGVTDPLSILAAPGAMTPEHADAIRDVYPRIYQRLVEATLEELQGAKVPPPYQARVRIALLFPEINPARSMTPDFLRRQQEPYLERHGGAQGGAMTGVGGAPPAVNPTPQLDETQLTRAQRLAEE